MVSKEVVNFARQSLKIDSRYDNQAKINGVPKDWTPAQKRRMRKQKNKWRRRFLGEF